MAMTRLLVALGLQLSAASTPVQEAGLIAGGLVEGFIGASDVKQCIERSEVVVGDLEQAIKDFEKKDATSVLQGLKLLAEGMATMPAALKGCRATATDIGQIINALKQMTAPSKFAFHVAKDVVVNGHNIYNEIMAAVNDYKSQKWEDFGIEVGTALHKLIVGAGAKFLEFESKFEKKYDSQSERLRRFEIFSNNLEDIEKLREVEEGSAVYSHLTPFADLLPEEFSVRNGFRSSLAATDISSAPLAEALVTTSLPDTFDWREKGAVNIVVKNQKSCGACWAFATVANIEGAGFVTTKTLLSLSEQELVDCDKKTGDVGCRGGIPSNAYKDMIQNNIGLETEAAYPYVAKDGTCKASASKEQVFIGGWLSISTDEDQIAAALMKYGPLAIGINAGRMQMYIGGVAQPSKLDCNPTQLDHGVAIVAFGMEWLPDGVKYWTIRNSWGPTWGEKGYYRIVRGTGACGLNTAVTTATNITFKGNSSQEPVVV